MKYLAIVQGDWNDADYVTSVWHLDNKEEADFIEEAVRIYEELETIFKKYIPTESVYRDWRYDTILEYLNRVTIYNDNEALEWDTSEEDIPAELLVFDITDIEKVIIFDSEYMPCGYESSCHTLTEATIYRVLEDGEKAVRD